MTCALSLVLAAAGAQAQPAAAQPETGRWITESGSLEVEIAACGPAFCGTVVRVIAKAGMPGAPAAAPAPAAPSPLGMKILFDLKPSDGGGLQGQIYNRNNKKIYNSLLQASGADQLKLTIYQDSPASGAVQLWRRPGGADQGR